MQTRKITVKLTERQADVADWLLGCPSMAEWFDKDVKEGHDFSHLDRPGLEDQILKLEIDSHLLDNIEHELDRYGDMAYENLGADGGKYDARVARNLAEKIFEKSPDEIVKKCKEIQRKRAEAIRKANRGD